MNQKPTIIIMVGVPGSGKSTYALDLMCSVKYASYSSLSVDAWIECVAQRQNKTYSEVFKEQIKPATKWFNGALLQSIEEKQNIIIDKTNVSVKSRKTVLDKANNYYKMAIYMDVPLETLKDRLENRAKETGKNIPWHVVENKYNELEIPSFNEGFDEIHIIKLR